MKNIHLTIIEDDQIVLESLSTFFNQISEVNLVNTFTSVESFCSYFQKTKEPLPEILLLDIQLPGKSGIEGIPQIKQIFPDINIIILTTFEESDKIFAALRAGACSYLSKQTSLSEIFECVKTVSNGGSFMSASIARKVVQFFEKPKLSTPLSPRQIEIVNCIVDGMSYKMIGAKLDISLDTVRTHIMQIYRTLNINSKGELIKWAIDGKR